jgi:hypothetical protein
MFTRNRLFDEYESHQRRSVRPTDEDLDALNADVSLQAPAWYKKALSGLGDGLISAGRSLKSQGESPASLTPRTRLT